MQEKGNIEKLRKKLLQWHYRKANTIKILDLLQSNYQSFRFQVSYRTGIDKIDFREAIKMANEKELTDLDITIMEEKLGI